ncbi:hypothetical protein AB0L65_32945 [Nonomuraea sp. NPDC052116]|uniref:hypothetical protein n=1 Tax=Nonomuraea sp. NPDC052116 TaxID=3155665 RepID=UPI0034295FF8
MTLATAERLNAELSAAVEGRPNWTLAYLGTPRLKAMYSPSDDVRGFIFPSRDDDGFWNGWTWAVLQNGHGCVRPEGDAEASAEKAVRLLEEFVANLDQTKG